MGLDKALDMYGTDIAIDPEQLRLLGMHALEYAARHNLADHERAELLAMIGMINAPAD